LRVIETASPAVSPNVVAAILITQNVSVTAGTLLRPVSAEPLAIDAPVFEGILGHSETLSVLVAGYPVIIGTSDARVQARLTVGPHH
jgi:hypothetical protein